VRAPGHPTSDASETPETFALSSYDYDLPEELIAQTPAEPRDAARLLVLGRDTGAIAHHHVRDLPGFLAPGDLVVVNRSRVIPCRLLGQKETGGRVELLLLRPLGGGSWLGLTRGHRLRTGQRVVIGADAAVEVGEPSEGARILYFPDGLDVAELLHRHGHVPLPPYIQGYEGDPERYQTVYADTEGSAAAPTAGLHFTPELIERLKSQGVEWATVTLHIGLDTFRPILDDDVRRHHIHTEWIDVPEATVEAVQQARARRNRVVAIGTTSVRALEHASSSGALWPYQGSADLFITPGYRFQTVGTMLTNFHLPRSSLMLLVSAFAGRERILAAYEEAVRLRYRFFSFGDAMLIL
jgi:S-adenosylmethionine:tRNA ribosyltransferase-isomerase